MTSSRHRLLTLSALALLLAAAGCSSTDDATSVAVPEPPADQVELCKALDKELPKTVAGQNRSELAPKSELTAGWGDAAIVLRCGVPRPDEMDDPQAKAVEADGVNWMLEQRADGPRFTTTYRKAYVEVTLGQKYAHDVTPLSDFASAIKKTDPSSL
ncbi:DUF3515 domain-containing protein [Streptomyces sp. NBC_01387]|uniref:DUF3515 domain-containing protein n=1 Tax=unclassified Streptomyces TaxID=2593676 RepID=UPI002256E549|nr:MULTISPECIES: DUF3515 domain-containing protein [unclassified Streptomyces]MCX4547931.1 DUF3515 domain-containing protein [Streptomyces sp. NBC_01500]WSC19604.1 DUF3515 domain-containing protein [Streptomyces sp. NBC_01766]WSV53625.1 DUF3515 domain-containing protein [Streptomyces sp. NBC_01014]